jgi:tetratricopeptide (TPR) repeat protein
MASTTFVSLLIRNSLLSRSVTMGHMPTETKELKIKLKVLLNEPTKQTQALEISFQLVEMLKNTSISEAWSVSREALHMAQKLNNEKRSADAHLNMADCSWKMAQMSLAVEHYESALNIFLHLQDHAGIARCYSGMGIVSAETGELEQALRYFEHAMQYVKLSPETKLAAVITGNFGHAYLKLQRHEDAMLCFEYALAEHTAQEDLEEMANVIEGMAGVHVQRGEYDTGLELMENVKDLRRREEPEPGRRMAISMMNTGITLLRMGQVRSAKQELEQARDLMVKVRFMMYEPEILKHLMHASMELNDKVEFNNYLHLYEEYRFEDIIQQARERHKLFREFRNAATQSLEQMLN